MMKNKGVCIFYIERGFKFFEKNTVSDQVLDKILNVNGVDELTYNKITKSIIVIYDTRILTSKRLFSRISKLFPDNKFLHKEASLKDFKKGVLEKAMDKFLEKLDKKSRDQVLKCKDMVFIMPVGAVMKPFKLYYKRLIAPTWLEFIFQVIML